MKKHLAERLENDGKDGRTGISYNSEEIVDDFTKYFKALSDDEKSVMNLEYRLKTLDEAFRAIPGKVDTTLPRDIA